MPGVGTVGTRAEGSLGRHAAPPTPTHIAGSIYHYDPSQVTAGYTMPGGARIDVIPERQGLWVKMKIPKHANPVATADWDPRLRALVVMVDSINHGMVRTRAAEKAELYSIDIGGTGDRPRRSGGPGVFPLIVKSAQTGEILFEDPEGYNTIPRPSSGGPRGGGVRGPGGVIA